MPQTFAEPDPALVQGILAAFDNLFGLHPGFRPAHAKGAMCSGTFTPAAAASGLTSAPHANSPSTPVLVRFSNSTGIPIIPDNDPNASPRGVAIRFTLGEHRHTDIVAHSADGFPTRTGEDFLGLLTAAATSGPDVPHPTPIEQFVGAHPEALRFVQMPKPFPTSFGHESFFGVTALKFTNAAGESHFGRFRIRPEAGNEYLTAEDAAAKSPNFLFEELDAKLASGPIGFKIVVQIAEPGDNVTDATTSWPADRKEIDFGTISITARVDDNDPEIHKVIFDPIPRVEGIDPSDDPLLAIRAAVYLMSGRRRRAASASGSPH